MTTRLSALLAPLFLLIYGVLRWIDGRDGHHGPSLPWNVGHTFFLASFVLLAVLLTAIRQRVVRIAPRRRVLAGVANAAALAGAACFVWVTLGDLFPDLASLPDALQVIGPLLFQAGALCLLALLVMARRLPVWSPVALLAGFLAIGLNLDLLPLGAIVIGAALAPLVAGRDAGSAEAAPSDPALARGAHRV